jgi:nitrite reductase/ring-hydroxylating ferredoxin subunit
MIAQEENNLLVQTNRGTPCGELMRRYWQPAALSEELIADKPLPVTLFGEELILFRDGQGNPGLIGRYCAHQGMDMIYSRVEPDGIRCLYHGWLFDTCGKVVVRGDWFPGGEQRLAVGQPAYPCAEIGGMIFTYLGSDESPALPAGETFVAPTKVLRAENYLRGIVGADETINGARFVAPNIVVSKAFSDTGSCVRWYVPVDSDSHIEFVVQSLSDLPLIGEPLTTAYQVLLKSIEGIASVRPAAGQD